VIAHIWIDNNGIHIGSGKADRLFPDPTADQVKPRESYVYAHVDPSGNIFYIGKDTGRRAWSDDRHSFWQRYVDTMAGGKYQVLILADGLSANEAESLESK
jgi:hypothetical protein